MRQAGDSRNADILLRVGVAVQTISESIRRKAPPMRQGTDSTEQRGRERRARSGRGNGCEEHDEFPFAMFLAFFRGRGADFHPAEQALKRFRAAVRIKMFMPEEQVGVASEAAEVRSFLFRKPPDMLGMHDVNGQAFILVQKKLLRAVGSATRSFWPCTNPAASAASGCCPHGEEAGVCAGRQSDGGRCRVSTRCSPRREF